MHQKTITISLHILAWICFFSLPFLVTPRHKLVNGRPSLQLVTPTPSGVDSTVVFIPAPVDFAARQQERAILVFVFNLLIVIFFYTNFWWLLPRLWQKKGMLYYLFGIVACGVLIIGFSVSMAPPFPRHPGMEEPPFPSIGMLAMFVMFLLAWAVSSGLWFAREYRKSEQLRVESDNARLDAELAQLKNQINPHFLFNTLNGIYTLTLSKSDAAPDAVMRLSQMMRYVLTEGSADHVPLRHDLDMLESFIQLHQMRLTADTTVNYTVDIPENDTHSIVPMMVLPFVENVFKYGTSTREKSNIDIAVRLTNNTLFFHCSNQIFMAASGNNPSGIGLANTQRRLDLLYPGKYQLHIQTRENRFEVHLELDLSFSSTKS